MPADIVDIAQELTESLVEKTLQKRSKFRPAFSGFCLNCEDPVMERRYCDRDCREAHEATQRRNIRSGTPQP